MKWQRYHAHQEGETDCGPACMRMVLNRHGVVVDTATLRESVGLGHGGASLLRLRDVLAGYGVESLLLKVSPEDLRIAVQKSGPAIAVMKEEGLLHFVVVHEVRSDGKLIVGDPVRFRPAVVSLEYFAERFNGEVLVTDTPQRKLTIRSVLHHARRNSVVWQIAAERKRSLLGTGLITAVTAILLIASTTFYLQVAVDRYLPAGDIGGLGLSALAAALIASGAALFQYIRGRLLINLSRSLQRDLTQAYTRKLMRLPLTFFATRRTGDLVSRFSDVQAIRGLVTTVTVGVAIDLCTLLFAGGYLAWASPLLCGIVFASAAIDFISSWALYPSVREQAEEALQRDASLKAEAYNVLRGQLDVIAHGRRQYAAARLDHHLERSIRAEVRLGRLENLNGVIKIANKGIFTIAAAWVGMLQVNSGSMALGELMSFFTLAGYFLSSTEQLAVLQVSIQRDTAALGRYRDVTSQVDDPRLKLERAAGGTEVEAARGGSELLVENLSFRYPGVEKPVISSLSFVVPHGARVALRGINGAGKSTVLKIVAGLYPEFGGSVIVGKTDIREFDEDALRRRILYVSENPLLVSASVRENLTLGAEFSSEEIERAVRVSCFGEVVAELPDGYDQYLKEEGGTLSRGQVQRLAIARAVLHSPDVFLFDETFSGIDEDTYVRIWKNLDELDCSKVMVSHREVPGVDFDLTMTVGE
ncbi:peptidase domain-containing ABC transporter [Streptomyces tubercidicus]|uniref:SPBc2 prophage-derived sublancin-168-processing and transport ATP-binding protein SunT n=1 Tax=Streptomyces tubercidicus TaxID=47759 RepID=A0A640UXX6_9ACTN|nr:peptidase domain-containing ABC transporter [Streptomyces tubercidicus]WAU13929.1 peptidase domain-containing ABC transporter [Streptomyces tubercidicus]GFE39601.1 SPBc2 prophage-derived sublancin-168-processing and transport ATP-binding protein SunT [Streptomyces tubercidicus]